MNFSENKLLGQGGEGSNCLGEGFSKFDYNGSVVSIYLQCLISFRVFCLSKAFGSIYNAGANIR